MGTKADAQNSLYVILFSQLTSMATTLIKGNMPEFELITLVLMVVIMFISLSNAWRYAQG